MKYFVEQDPLDRELQSKELGRIMAASYPRPVVFLGYVVTKPHAERREFLFCFHVKNPRPFLMDLPPPLPLPSLAVQVPR